MTEDRRQTTAVNHVGFTAINPTWFMEDRSPAFAKATAGKQSLGLSTGHLTVLTEKTEDGSGYRGNGC